MDKRGVVGTAPAKDRRAKLPYVAPTYARHDSSPEAGGHKNADAVYTLYRGSAADPSVRFHVATFDTDDGEEHNHALCEYAREMFQAQAGEGERFWCERGYFRPIAER